MYENLSTGKNARKLDDDPIIPFSLDKKILNGKTKIKADLPNKKKNLSRKG